MAIGAHNERCHNCKESLKNVLAAPQVAGKGDSKPCIHLEKVGLVSRDHRTGMDRISRWK